MRSSLLSTHHAGHSLTGNVDVLFEAPHFLRSPHNWHQLAKYCVVGLIGNGISLGVYYALIRHGLHYLLAAACAFPIGVTANYTLNRHWTFRDRRGGVTTQGVRFFAVSLATLGANIVLLDVLIRIVGIDKLPAQAIAIIVLTPLNFLSNKLWSFGKPKPAT